MDLHTHRIGIRELIAAVLALILALGVIAPLAAQEEAESLEDLTEDDAAIVIGEYGYNEHGDIIVTATDEETGETVVYIIAPAGAFTPSSVQEGDMVIIIGRLLPDGVTVQAMTFEFFVEEEEEEAGEEPEATEEPEMTPEPEATEEPEMTPEPEVTEEPVVATCGNANHPVAARLAEEFGMSQGEIMAMHCQGNGFGNIARALLLARAAEDGTTAQDYLDRHHAGEGWGHIVRESGMHPSELAPGRIGKGRSTTTEDSAQMTTRPGNGNRNNGNNNRDNRNNGNRGGNGGGNGGGNRGGGRNK